MLRAAWWVFAVKPSSHTSRICGCDYALIHILQPVMWIVGILDNIEKRAL
jgi:hypothetical protein